MKKLIVLLILTTIIPLSAMNKDIESQNKLQPQTQPTTTTHTLPNLANITPSTHQSDSNPSVCLESLVGTAAVMGVVFIPSAMVGILVWSSSNF